MWGKKKKESPAPKIMGYVASCTFKEKLFIGNMANKVWVILHPYIA